MGDGVDGIDLVLAVEIGVEGVHHHDEFLPARVLGRAEQPRARRLALLGMARRIGIDDEGAVHALVDVPLQRQRVAVVEVAAERTGVELVDELFARRRSSPAPGTPSMRAAWMPWKCMVCGCEPVVLEDDAQPVALGGREASGPGTRPL